MTLTFTIETFDDPETGEPIHNTAVSAATGKAKRP